MRRRGVQSRDWCSHKAHARAQPSQPPASAVAAGQRQHTPEENNKLFGTVLGIVSCVRLSGDNMKVPRSKVLRELRLRRLRSENLGPETDKEFLRVASEISRKSALVQKDNKPVNTLVKGKSWAKERDSVLFWETKHQKGDPRTVFGSRFHVIQADPFGDNEAKIFKYKRPCIFCGSRFACRIPIKRMKRFTPGLRNPWAELGTMVTKKSVPFAAHQKCLDYASGESR